MNVQMADQKTIDAFSSVIQKSLEFYENSTPLYYHITHYVSLVVVALGILSLAFILSTIKQKKPHRFIVLVLCLWLGYEGIHIPRPNLAVFYGYNLAQIAYPANENPNSFLHRADGSNPVCCSIGEDEYLQAKRRGFKEYADAKAKALAELVEMESGQNENAEIPIRRPCAYEAGAFRQTAHGRHHKNCHSAL